MTETFKSKKCCFNVILDCVKDTKQNEKHI